MKRNLFNSRKNFPHVTFSFINSEGDTMLCNSYIEKQLATLFGGLVTDCYDDVLIGKVKDISIVAVLDDEYAKANYHVAPYINE